jgi:hypothetical protein
VKNHDFSHSELRKQFTFQISALHSVKIKYFTQKFAGYKKGMVIYMSEQLKILEMIEKGQITAAEGQDLLDALNATKETEQEAAAETAAVTPKRNYKYFKVKVTSDNSTLNVNVNVPLRLLSTIGTIADRMTTMIPMDARKEMESKGIDITTIDFAKIIEEILDGTLDDPNIVDVEAWDETHKAMVKVKVYVE